MADLRTEAYKNLKLAYQKFVTLGAKNELQDGQGINVPVNPFEGRVGGGELSLTDDTFGTFDFSNQSGYDLVGTMIISCIGSNYAGISAICSYRMRAAGSSAEIIAQHSQNLFQATVGTATGTAGTNGYATIFVDNASKIHIENRLGSADQFCVHFLGRGFI